MTVGTMRVRQSLFTTHPARTVVLAFATVILGGTALLSLPIASEQGSATGFVTALFTSTSAVCVTGLVVVDTGTYWSGFGEGVILALIQVGGFGIMTLASLLLISGRLRLRMQLTAQAETKSLGIGDARRVLLGVAATTLAVELAVGAILAVRFRFGYANSIGDAVYLGFFHAVSAFNNAGFGLHADSLTRYAQDAWVTLPISVAVILGGIGFPVLLELLRHGKRRRATGRRRWSLHAKLTLVTTAALLPALRGSAAAFGGVPRRAMPPPRRRDSPAIGQARSKGDHDRRRHVLAQRQQPRGRIRDEAPKPSIPRKTDAPARPVDHCGYGGRSLERSASRSGCPRAGGAACSAADYQPVAEDRGCIALLDIEKTDFPAFGTGKPFVGNGETWGAEHRHSSAR